MTGLHLTADARGGGKRGRVSTEFFVSYLRRTLFDVDRATATQQARFHAGSHLVSQHQSLEAS